MTDSFDEIAKCLLEKMPDTIPQYILRKDIFCSNLNLSQDVFENNLIEQSKWYKQLASEQWENGSWGRFHTQDTKSAVKQKFSTTEAALSRAYDLSLDKNNRMIRDAIHLMERYLQGEEQWLDTNEHHYGFHVAFKTLIAANLSVFIPDHPIVLVKKKICAENIEKAFQNGFLDESVWEKENRLAGDILLKPYTVYIIWLLQDNPYLPESLQRQYLKYIWYRDEGIYYRTNTPANQVEYLESKRFPVWLTGLETMSRFSLFPEFMDSGIYFHLFNEMLRLKNEDVKLPVSTGLTGHYSENWIKENRKNDLLLRILRILIKCPGHIRGSIK